VTPSTNVRIDTSATLDPRMWDKYVYSHPASNLYQCTSWFRAIEAAYGHPAFFITAYRSSTRVAGVLPLVCMRGLSLKKQLVSAPFCDMGGIVADDAKTPGVLIRAAMRLAKREHAARIVIRQPDPLSCMEEPYANRMKPLPRFKMATNKVRMVLCLPESSKALFNGFKSKLRSQIKRPEKSGLIARVGGREFLGDFYHVFVRNMRDLGSPVHSKSLIEQVLNNFKGRARIVVVYKGDYPIAGSVIIGFRDAVINPWASALREFSALSPNMLLYWSMLRYACDNGYRIFDFGRSTPGEGTHQFKKQWGAKERPLAWYQSLSHRDAENVPAGSQTRKFGKAIEYWSRMPLPLTRIAGPLIRKHIDL